jgi:hypothetical protein
VRAVVAVVVLMLAAGCARTRPSSSGTASCAELYTRLQQVSATVSATTELLTNSLGSQQLSDRIAFEEEQLRQSAQLMASASVPDTLAATNRQLVAALQAMAADFARAKAPAARGDFAAASQAMTDQTAVQHIVDASQKIESACA